MLTAMRLIPLLLAVGKVLCDLQYHGMITDMDGEEVNLYTTEVVDTTEAISEFHASYNETRPHLERRGGDWRDCDHWGTDFVGGGAGCNSRHSPGSFYRIHGEASTHVFIQMMLNSTVGVEAPRNKGRNNCIKTGKHKLCISWAKRVNRAVDPVHIAKATDFSVHCLKRFDYSSMIMTDEVNREWAWICVSNRPKGCHSNICGDWRHHNKHGVLRPDGSYYNTTGGNMTEGWLEDTVDGRY